MKALVWALPEDEESLLELAKGYPFEQAGCSFLYRDGGYAPLSAAPLELFEKRTPVIGHGSNRSPAQLKRKFEYLSGEDSMLPVTRAWIAEYDVVYSAHVTQYGSIAANLQHAPGVRSEVVVNWLNDEQLQRMHDTELGGENYFYGVMEGIDLALEVGPTARMDHCQIYISTRGCLALDGQPVGLAAVAVEGRHYPTLEQVAVQEAIFARHRPASALDAQILKNIRDADERADMIARLTAEAVPQAAPHFKALVAP